MVAHNIIVVTFNIFSSLKYDIFGKISEHDTCGVK